MKPGSIVLAVLVLIFFITGCVNRFEEYEPYSAFDARMSYAEKGRPYPPDDQMPPPAPYPYTADQYTSAYDQDPIGYRGSGTPRMNYRTPGSSDEGEVPFTSSRGPNRPMNIGAD